jgi:hypothetical protein
MSQEDMIKKFLEDNEVTNLDEQDRIKHDGTDGKLEKVKTVSTIKGKNARKADRRKKMNCNFCDREFISVKIKVLGRFAGWSKYCDYCYVLRKNSMASNFKNKKDYLEYEELERTLYGRRSFNAIKDEPLQYKEFFLGILLRSLELKPRETRKKLAEKLKKNIEELKGNGLKTKKELDDEDRLWEEM